VLNIRQLTTVLIHKSTIQKILSLWLNLTT